MVNKEEDNNTNKQCNCDSCIECNCDSCIECNCDPEVCRCDCHTDKTLIRDFEWYERCKTLL